MPELKTLHTLVNAALYYNSMALDFVYTSMAPKNEQSPI